MLFFLFLFLFFVFCKLCHGVCYWFAVRFIVDVIRMPFFPLGGDSGRSGWTKKSSNKKGRPKNFKFNWKNKTAHK